MEENKKNHLRRSFIQKELNIIYTQDCYAHINHYIMTYGGYSKTGQVLTQYNWALNNSEIMIRKWLYNESSKRILENFKEKNWTEIDVKTGWNSYHKYFQNPMRKKLNPTVYYGSSRGLHVFKFFSLDFQPLGGARILFFRLRHRDQNVKNSNPTDFHKEIYTIISKCAFGARKPQFKSKLNIPVILRTLAIVNLAYTWDD